MMEVLATIALLLLFLAGLVWGLVKLSKDQGRIETKSKSQEKRADVSKTIVDTRAETDLDRLRERVRRRRERGMHDPDSDR